MPIPPYLRWLRGFVGTERLLVTACDAVILDERGRVLLLRRADNGLWDLPGGIADPGEPPARTLVREVWEETGLKVVPERLLLVNGGTEHRVTYPNGDQVEFTVCTFACRVVGGRLQPRDGEAVELRYVAPHDMPDTFSAYVREAAALASEDAPTRFAWDPGWLDQL